MSVSQEAAACTLAVRELSDRFMPATAAIDRELALRLMRVAYLAGQRDAQLADLQRMADRGSRSGS